MNRRFWLIAALAMIHSGTAMAVEDPGRAQLARVSVTVYHATDGDPTTSGSSAVPVSKELAARLSSEERLRFKHYRRLGQDIQPLLRSYESWAQPLKPAEDVLVRFEAQGRPRKGTALLDLELWLNRKKIVKADAKLEGEKPLFMLGPEWRGGRLIIAVALAPKENPVSN